MSEDGTQKWIGRNRPPRVQITYDLETRGAIEKKELPLVVGIIADLSGKDNTAPSDVAALKGQKFIEIDRDNFDDVMKSISPTLSLSAFSQTAELITFKTIDDFTPDKLVENVTALKAKLTRRQQLSDLLVAVDRNEALGDDLLDVALVGAAADAKTKSDAATAAANNAPDDTDLSSKAAAARDEYANAAGQAAAALKTTYDAATAAAKAAPADADLSSKAAAARDDYANAASQAAAAWKTTYDAATAAATSAKATYDAAVTAATTAKATYDTDASAATAAPTDASLSKKAADSKNLSVQADATTADAKTKSAAADAAAADAKTKSAAADAALAAIPAAAKKGNGGS